MLYIDSDPFFEKNAMVLAIFGNKLNHFLEDRCIIYYSDLLFKENAMVLPVFGNGLTIFRR